MPLGKKKSSIILKRIMLPSNMKNLKIYTIFCLSGYRDSNAGPPAPKAGALTGLRYTPKPLSGTKVRIISQSTIPSPQENPLGEGVARGRSDPGGIQTHDLQNRNLTLYSAKLPSLIASLCPAKVHFSSQPLDIPPSKERRCTYNWKIHVLLSCPSLLRWLLLVV